MTEKKMWWAKFFLQILFVLYYYYVPSPKRVFIDRTERGAVSWVTFKEAYLYPLNVEIGYDETVASLIGKEYDASVEQIIFRSQGGILETHFVSNEDTSIEIDEEGVLLSFADKDDYTIYVFPMDRDSVEEEEGEEKSMIAMSFGNLPLRPMRLDEEYWMGTHKYIVKKGRQKGTKDCFKTKLGSVVCVEMDVCWRANVPSLESFFPWKKFRSSVVSEGDVMVKFTTIRSRLFFGVFPDDSQCLEEERMENGSLKGYTMITEDSLTQSTLFYDSPQLDVHHFLRRLNRISRGVLALIRKKRRPPRVLNAADPQIVPFDENEEAEENEEEENDDGNGEGSGEGAGNGNGNIGNDDRSSPVTTNSHATSTVAVSTSRTQSPFPTSSSIYHDPLDPLLDATIIWNTTTTKIAVSQYPLNHLTPSVELMDDDDENDSSHIYPNSCSSLLISLSLLFLSILQ